MHDAKRALNEGWGLDGGVEPLGDGHINDSFLATTAVGRFVLQRINEFVFEQPTRLIDNQRRVVTHLQTVAPGFVPELVSSQSGAAGWVDERGAVWKLTHYVDRSRTCESLSANEARAAAAAFARYQQLLSTYVGPRIEDPIDGFLRLEGYLAAWDDVASGEWQAFIDHRRTLAAHFANPDRYIHGDCKINNVLFHADTTNVIAVIDLDTTMWGHWAWDFGDLVRSAATSSGTVDIDLFSAVASGFTSTMQKPVESSDLVLAPRYMAFCLGLRFLTDHLQGDVYFKTTRANENLERAAAQFALVKSMEERAGAMVAAAEAALARRSLGTG